MSDPLDLSRDAAVDAAHGRVAQIELEAVKSAFNELKRRTRNGHSIYLAMVEIVSDLESRTPLPKAQNQPTKFCCGDS